MIPSLPTNSNSECLNLYRSIFRIEKGITTKAEVTNFNLNQVYSITYDGYDKTRDTTDSTTMIYKFSRKGGDSNGFITFPKLSNSNMTFNGWWDENGKLIQCYDSTGTAIQCYDAEGNLIHDYTATDIQKILIKNNLTDHTFYAKWLVKINENITVEPFYDDIVISIDKTTIAKTSDNKKFTFTSKGTKDGVTSTIPVGSGENKISYTYEVTYHREIIHVDTYYTTDANTLTFLASLPFGTYTINITAVYNGKTYSASFNVNIFETLTASEAVTYISSMTASETLKISGTITADELKNIASAIYGKNASAVKICLDLSEVTGLSEFPEERISSKGLFEECDALEGITLPKGVVVHGSIFKECRNLKYIKGGLNPNGDSGIVWNCSSLEYIVFPVTYHIFPTNFLSGCTKFTTVYYMGTETQWNELPAGEKTPFASYTIIFKSIGPS